MIRILLNGAQGKMGRVLSQLIEPIEDMEVVAGIDIHPGSREFPIFASLTDCTEEADILIDFSTPESVREYLPEAVSRSLSLVVATTGLEESDVTALKKASENIPVFRSANMSIGINLVQQLLEQVSRHLYPAFDVEIIERHHNQKKDAPSGTALMLANSINESVDDNLSYIYGRQGTNTKRQAGELGIHAVRGGTIVGDHEVIFAGNDEIISIRHQAFSRQVFGNGAIAAARYISSRAPGLYSMREMLS